MYCLKYFHENNIDVDKEHIEKYKAISGEVSLAIYAMELNYQFVKNTPEDIQKSLEIKIDRAKKLRVADTV